VEINTPAIVDPLSCPNIVGKCVDLRTLSPFGVTKYAHESFTRSGPRN